MCKSNNEDDNIYYSLIDALLLRVCSSSLPSSPLLLLDELWRFFLLRNNKLLIAFAYFLDLLSFTFCVYFFCFRDDDDDKEVDCGGSEGVNDGSWDRLAAFFVCLARRSVEANSLSSTGSSSLSYQSFYKSYFYFERDMWVALFAFLPNLLTFDLISASYFDHCALSKFFPFCYLIDALSSGVDEDVNSNWDAEEEREVEVEADNRDVGLTLFLRCFL